MSVNIINTKNESYNERLSQLERKKAYLKNNPLSYEDEKKNLQRIDNLLNALDVIDDYSAKKTDGTKNTTFFLIASVDQGLSYLGSTLGMIIASLPFVKKHLNKFAQKVDTQAGKIKNAAKINTKNAKIPDASTTLTSALPVLFCAALGYLISNPIANMIRKAHQKITKNEFQDIAKHELSDPKYFAVLNDEQMQYVEFLMRTQITNEEIKNEFKNHKLNLIDASKTIIGKDEDNFLNDFKLENKESLEKYYNEANEDRRLILDAMAKIDHDSSLYSQKIDKISNLLSLLADIMSSAVIVPNLQQKSQNLPIKTRILKLIFELIPISIAITFGFLSQYLSSENEKIGRFVAKENLRNNPQYLYDVNMNEQDENIKPQDKKSKNPIKNFINDVKTLYKDYKEYTLYHSRHHIQNRKKQKAMSKVNMSNEQLERAKMFQKNTLMVCDNFYNKKHNVKVESEEKKNKLTNAASIVLNLTAMILAPLFISLNWDSFIDLVKTLKNNNGKINIKSIYQEIKAFAPSLAALFIPCVVLYAIKNKATDDSHKNERKTSLELARQLDNTKLFM